MQIVEVKGKDSAEFLQRVTAGAVRSVAEGRGRAGLLLNGQSRMIAQFDLLRLVSDRFLLVAPLACAPALAEELERLHFSEALEIGFADFSAGVCVRPAGSVRDADGSFAWRQEGEKLFWPAPVDGYEFATGHQGFPFMWDFDRIGALLPWPPHDWDASTPALEAGVLPWIDRAKGCYPGQEVVERSLNVGHPARVLVAVECGDDRALVAGESLAFGSSQGRVSSTATRQGKTRALMRVPWAGREAVPQGFKKLLGHW